MIKQLKDMKVDILRTHHYCDRCRKHYDFWEKKVSAKAVLAKIGNWYTDDSQHGCQYCDKCYEIVKKEKPKCKKCGNTNPFMLRDGNKTCVQCLNKEIKDYSRKQQEKDKKTDAKHKKESYLYKAAAWIHPSGGGDDYRVDYYFPNKPTKETIVTLLRQAHSAVLNDFVISKL